MTAPTQPLPPGAGDGGEEDWDDEAAAEAEEQEAAARAILRAQAARQLSEGERMRCRMVRLRIFAGHYRDDMGLHTEIDENRLKFIRHLRETGRLSEDIIEDKDAG